VKSRERKLNMEYDRRDWDLRVCAPYRQRAQRDGGVYDDVREEAEVAQTERRRWWRTQIANLLAMSGDNRHTMTQQQRLAAWGTVLTTLQHPSNADLFEEQGEIVEYVRWLITAIQANLGYYIHNAGRSPSPPGR
jgi:hypothetical protein